MNIFKAHMAFGSIDVPSVVEKRDLEMFCMLDYQHSQCIDECGYSVQFNLREYVCRNRFPEVSFVFVKKFNSFEFKSFYSFARCCNIFHVMQGRHQHSFVIVDHDVEVIKLWCTHKMGIHRGLFFHRTQCD